MAYRCDKHCHNLIEVSIVTGQGPWVYEALLLQGGHEEWGLAQFLASRRENCLKWVETLELSCYSYREDVLHQTLGVKLGPGRGQSRLSCSGDMRSASTWHSTKGIPGHLQRGRLSTEWEWGSGHPNICPSLRSWLFPLSWSRFGGKYFSDEVFPQWQHQADKGDWGMKLLLRVGAGERNIHLTEYLVYQICKCRVLEYFVCAHLKFGNIYRAWLLATPKTYS